jgi:hypothetical protein
VAQVCWQTLHPILRPNFATTLHPILRPNSSSYLATKLCDYSSSYLATKLCDYSSSYLATKLCDYSSSYLATTLHPILRLLFILSCDQTLRLDNGALWHPTLAAHTGYCMVENSGAIWTQIGLLYRRKWEMSGILGNE